MEANLRSAARSRVAPLLAAAVMVLTVGVAPVVAQPAAGPSVTHVADSEWGD